VKTQVFLASTAFGLATLAAAIDDGQFGPDTTRVLVLSNNANVPEATPAINQIAGWDTLRTRFDTVVDLNAAVAPVHPSAWVPRTHELPTWERYFRAVWGLGDSEIHLVVESIQVSPAMAVCRAFADASIDVYADGLMSYGPTRNRLPDDVAWRIERLLHLDLVPGLDPILLTEWRVPPVVISSAAFRTVIAQLSPDHVRPAAPVVLVLGQYFAAANLLTVEEELELYQQMILGAAARHQHRVMFKPHPSAPLSQRLALLTFAAEAGVDLEVATGQELAESWFATGSIALVVGCFSTALATAATLYDIPAARLGTGLLLDRLTPFHNSNRVPATIVDAVVPDLSHPDAPPPVARPALPHLVAAVGYTMQPIRYPGRRAEAVEFLTAHPDLHARYFKRRRLTRLDLPGRLPPREEPVISRAEQTWSELRRTGLRVGRSGLRRLRKARTTLVERRRPELEAEDPDDKLPS